MPKWINLYRTGELSVGMWPYGKEVWFTYERCEDKELEEDIEFSVDIEDLKEIVEAAETHKEEEKPKPPDDRVLKEGEQPNLVVS